MQDYSSVQLDPHEEAVFEHVKDLYGSHPQFAAAQGPIRALIALIARNSVNLTSNPKILSILVASLGLVFPSAAPILAQLAPIVVALGPVLAELNSTAIPAPASPTHANDSEVTAQP